MNSTFQIKTRSPSGINKLELSSESKISHLVFEILKFEKKVQNPTDIQNCHKNSISVKKGFPPKPVSLENFDLEASISELGVKNNDNLVIEIDESKLSSSPQKQEYGQNKVPSDGSCLFNSICLGVEGRSDKP